MPVRDGCVAARGADVVAEHVLRGPRERTAEERVPLQELETDARHRYTDSCVSRTTMSGANNKLARPWADCKSPIATPRCL